MKYLNTRKNDGWICTCDTININAFQCGECYQYRFKKDEEVSKVKTPLKRYKYLGDNLTINQWSKKTGIQYNTLYLRIRKGWNIKRSLSTPIREYIKSTW